VKVTPATINQIYDYYVWTFELL